MFYPNKKTSKGPKDEDDIYILLVMVTDRQLILFHSLAGFDLGLLVMWVKQRDIVSDAALPSAIISE